MNTLQIGQRVKINYGMGRTEYGTVADIRVNRWGRQAVVFMENGEEEWVDGLYKNGTGTGSEIGCHLA